MRIETERLELVLLTAEQLNLWATDLSKLEKQLNCAYKAEPLEDWFVEMLKSHVAPSEKDNHNLWCHSFWFLIRKSDRVVVGSADFKDIPNNDGEVEIGYGLGKEYEGNGYMTEAVQAMCNYALIQPGVKSIIAETYLDGIKSQHILQKCGFVKYKEAETMWWKLNK